MPCAHGLFPPTLSALVHAHGVQELSLSLANGRCVGWVNGSGQDVIRGLSIYAFSPEMQSIIDVRVESTD